MLDQQHILQVIYAAVDEVNGQLPPQARLAKTPGTVLVGDGATLDSLALVNLLAVIEDKVSQTEGIAIGLLDQISNGADDMMPLRTFGAVAAFIASSAGNDA